MKKEKKETAREKELKIGKLRSITYKWNYNKKAMNYCLSNNLSIYPAAQSNNKIFLFVQQGERFKRLDNITYSQDSEEDILIYTVEIIKAYERYARKIKLKKDEQAGKKTEV